MKPGILMYPHTFCILVRRNDLLKFILAVGRVKGDLPIAGRNILFIREYPYLQKLNGLIVVLILLAVLNATSGTHHLYIPMFNYLGIAHTVFVFQVTF